ncbi:flp/fap pilus protein [Hyphomonas neptunium ATCC 15444]|uniref:Flp/fap pilus protein n=2 Tax=Hyphomonas TaxID=85 RepID=Q0BXE6_HYPNA|nr:MULTISPECIES: Flp family type IVb pilin [Hyphomonas]ABI76193.1 flp/fap pilus protein [Hyphomonas neptunium ATCC 15444]KCZ89953.1 flp/Fap pilus protein [Hyphomonas hirschiana VP5]
MRLTKTLMLRLARDERGATAIEYGLIAGLMVLAIIGGVTAFADANNEIYQTVEDNLVQA